MSLLLPALNGVLSFSCVCSDLGVHVDGFISNIAHSLVVGATKVSHFIPTPASCLTSFKPKWLFHFDQFVFF